MKASLHIYIYIYSNSWRVKGEEGKDGGALGENGTWSGSQQYVDPILWILMTQSTLPGSMQGDNRNGFIPFHLYRSLC